MMDQLHVVATGSRLWDDESIIRVALEELPPSSRVAHGGCQTGADPIVDRIARELGHTVVIYPAEWSRHPRGSAGPIRNSRMARLEQPQICLAFLLRAAANKGTTNCILACIKSTGCRCEIKRFWW